MSASSLLARIRSRGIKLRADGADLVVVAPDGALVEADLEALRRAKPELLRLLGSAEPQPAHESIPLGCDKPAGDPLEWFLRDASIPLAVFRSHALRRHFVVARDAETLASLDEHERRLPVLTFADCEKLSGLLAADVASILDVREAFGPAAELVVVRPRLG